MTRDGIDVKEPGVGVGRKLEHWLDVELCWGGIHAVERAGVRIDRRPFQMLLYMPILQIHLHWNR